MELNARILLLSYMVTNENIYFENFFYIMYFGLQDTKPPPCPLHLTKQGGSIHWSQLYLYAVHKLVLYKNIYFENYYDEQHKFTNESYSIQHVNIVHHEIITVM